MALAVFSFDNLGAAAEVGAGTADGPDPSHPSLVEGLPRLLDVLDEIGLRATFFVEGWNGLHHPEAVRSIVERGHDLGVHGWAHEEWGDLAPAIEADLLGRATDAIGSAVGRAPTGFRAPGGRRTAATGRLLRAHGYTYDASLAPDGCTEAPRPTVLDGGVLSLPFVWSGVDGYWYLRDTPAKPPDVARAWNTALDDAAEADGVFLTICHPFITGVDAARTDALAGVMRRAVADPRVAVATVAEAVGADDRVDGPATGGPE